MSATGPRYPFWWVRKGDSLWNISKQAFGLTSNSKIVAKVKELVHLNPHIKNPDVIRTGTVLFLGHPGGSATRPAYLSDMSEIETEISRMSYPEQTFLYDNWDELCVLEKEMNGRGTVLPVAAAGSPLWMDYAKWGKRVASVTQKALSAGIKGQFGNFLSVSPHAFRQIEGTLRRGLQTSVRYYSKPSGVLGLIPNNARAIATHGKIILIDPASSGFRTFSAQVKALKGFARDVLKPLGKLSKPIDIGFAGYNILDNWGTSQQNKTIVVETSKVAGGWGAGAAGASAATPVCAALGAAGGAPGVICFVVVVGGSSFAGSKAGAWAGEQIHAGGAWVGEKINDAANALVREVEPQYVSPYFRLRW